MANEKKVCMKSKILLAAALVFAMSFLGCGGGSNGEHEGGVDPLLTFSNQEVWFWHTEDHVWRHYDGPNYNFDPGLFNITGGVAGGMLTFTANAEGAPDYAFGDLSAALDLWFWADPPAAVEAARAGRIELGTNSGMIWRGYRHYDEDAIAGTREAIHESVNFIWVDSQVNVVFPGGVDLFSGHTYEAFTLNLQEGWNTVLRTETRTDIFNTPWPGWNLGAGNVTMELANPDRLRWFVTEF